MSDMTPMPGGNPLLEQFQSIAGGTPDPGLSAQVTPKAPSIPTDIGSQIAKHQVIAPINSPPPALSAHDKDLQGVQDWATQLWSGKHPSSSGNQVDQLTSASPGQGTSYGQSLPGSAAPTAAPTARSVPSPISPVKIPEVNTPGPQPLTPPPDAGTSAWNQLLAMSKNPLGKIDTPDAGAQTDYVKQYLDQHKNQSFPQLLGNIFDIIGTGARSFRDPNQQTRWQQGYSLAQQANQEAAKQQAENVKTNSVNAGQGNISQNVLKNTLPLTTASNIATGLAPITPQAEANLYESLGTLGGQLKNGLSLIDEQTKQDVLKTFATLAPEMQKKFAEAYVALSNSHINTYAPGAGTGAPGK